jgi:hypothetical protein
MSPQISDTVLTAVLYSSKDAQRLLKEHPNVDRVLTLTPDARATLTNSTLPLLTTLDTYSDYDHRRVMVRVRRMEKQLKNKLDSLDISISSKETLSALLHLIASFTSRLWETLKNTGPWLVPTPLGWVNISDLHEAHRTLLVHISTQSPPFSLGVDKSLWSPIIRILNQLLLKITKKQHVVLLTGYSYGLTSISQELNQRYNHFTTMDVRGSTGKFREVFKVLLSIFHAITGQPKITYTAVPTYSEKKISAIEEYLTYITDPVIQNAIEFFKHRLTQDTILTDGLNKDTDLLVKSVCPKAVWSHSLRWGIGAVLGEVSLLYKIPCILISHGSHPKPENVTSAFEHRELAQGLLFSPLASNNLLQSPHAEQAVSSFGESFLCTRSHPVMWSYSKTPTIIKKDSIKTILHAGTFKRWDVTRPWIYETSDEFIEGLSTLIQATTRLKNVELIIRIRPMLECQIKTLKVLLPKSNCYKIKTSGSFLEDLALADLLVSYSSTTIEEALYARRPVLLWGGSQRYMHLPVASTEKPTETSRSAVYAPKAENELLPMLTSILEYHASKPLTNYELKGHIWFDDVPSKYDFIKEMVL